MLNFRRGDHVAIVGAHRVALPFRCKVDIHVASSHPVTVCAVYDDGAVPILVGNYLNETVNLTGFNELSVRSAKGAETGCSVKVRTLQLDEPRNDDPVPARGEAARNILARIREESRRSMGVMREAFLMENDTMRPGYEFDDDGPALFEEDEAELERLAAEEEQQGGGQSAPESETEGEGEEA